MEKEQIISKLKDIGINTLNAYPKKSFLHNGIVVISCYKRELKEDFFFYNSFSNSIYKIPLQDIDFLEFDTSREKYIIPETKWEKIWEDKPFEELPDVPFKEMTLRQYACIQLKVPETDLPWLNEIIKKSL